MAIRHEAVIQSWTQMIPDAAGRGKSLLDTIENRIKEMKIPNVTTAIQDISGGMFGSRRPFLCVNHAHYSDYRVYICAREYGTNLDVGWYMTCQPRFLKRTLSKYATGDPKQLSMQVDFFSQQDINAFITVINHIVETESRALFDELQLAPSARMGSKGFLELW